MSSLARTTLTSAYALALLLSCRPRDGAKRPDAAVNTPELPAADARRDSARRTDSLREADSAGTPTASTGAIGRMDDTTISRLEHEAHTIAKTTGCRTSGECRTAPVGHKACGGPRSYLVYCPLTTDSAALFSKLAELARVERAIQERDEIASTCEAVLPPAVQIVGGRCMASGRPGMEVLPQPAEP